MAWGVGRAGSVEGEAVCLGLVKVQRERWIFVGSSRTDIYLCSEAAERGQL